MSNRPPKSFAQQRAQRAAQSAIRFTPPPFLGVDDRRVDADITDAIRTGDHAAARREVSALYARIPMTAQVNQWVACQPCLMDHRDHVRAIWTWPAPALPSAPPQTAASTAITPLHAHELPMQTVMIEFHMMVSVDLTHLGALRPLLKAQGAAATWFYDVSTRWHNDLENSLNQDGHVAKRPDYYLRTLISGQVHDLRQGDRHPVPLACLWPLYQNDHTDHSGPGIVLHPGQPLALRHDVGEDADATTGMMIKALTSDQLVDAPSLSNITDLTQRLEREAQEEDKAKRKGLMGWVRTFINNGSKDHGGHNSLGGGVLAALKMMVGIAIFMLVLSICIGLGLALTMLAISTARGGVMAAADQNWGWMLFFTAVFCLVVWALWRLVQFARHNIIGADTHHTGQTNQTPSQRSAQGGEPARRQWQPSLWRRLRGWVNWNNPVNQKTKQAFEKRLEEVRQLMSQGQMDEALKRAISVATEAENRAAAKAKRHYFPDSPPEIRANLDLTPNDAGGWVRPILSNGVHHELIAQYNQLADELVQTKEFQRAAFVYAKLLNQPYIAVTTLEKGGMFAEAAELALATQQDAPLIIRLFYLAGQQDKALQLARRYGDFAHLAKMTEKGDQILYSFVIDSWVSQLEELGHWLRALSVSDTLAQRLTKKQDGVQQSGDDPRHMTASALAARRRLWLLTAVREWANQQTDQDHQNYDLLARAILMLPWSDGDWSFGMAHPLAVDVPATTAEKSRVLQVVHEGLTGERQSDVREGYDIAPSFDATALLHALTKVAEPKSTEQAGFWQTDAAEEVTTALTQRLMLGVDQKCRLTGTAHGSLKTLLAKARNLVMLEDLKRIKLVHSSTPNNPPAQTIELRSRRDDGDAVQMICPLYGPATSHGSTTTPQRYGAMVWMKSGRLAQVSLDGQTRDEQWLSHIIALVPIVTSGHVLVIQAAPQDGGQRRLSVYHGATKRLVDLGLLALRHWAPTARDGQWMVQVDYRIMALDLAGLTSKTQAAINSQWHVDLGEQLQVRAFRNNAKGQFSWLTFNPNEQPNGLFELWHYIPSTLQLTTQVLMVPDMDAIAGPMHWSGHSAIGFAYHSNTSPQGTAQIDVRWAQTRPYAPDSVDLALKRSRDKPNQGQVPTVVSTQTQFAKVVRFDDQEDRQPQGWWIALGNTLSRRVFQIVPQDDGHPTASSEVASIAQRASTTIMGYFDDGHDTPVAVGVPYGQVVLLWPRSGDRILV